MTDFTKISEQAARAGGAVLMSWLGKINAKEKAPRDLVTEADLASQKEIERLILDAFPDHGFLGEESSDAIDTPNPDSPYRWIVDPLDGTTNFVHQMPAFSVSVALEHEDKIIAGTIYDPTMDECFSAAAGEGATRNGQPIRVSGCSEIEKALTVASFSARVPKDSIEIRRFTEMLYEAQAVRRLGSAAMNLAYVACGRMDAYWAANIKIWDVAAGLLLVEEAGGRVSDLWGKAVDLDNPKILVSASAELQAKIVEVLGRAEG